MIANQELNQKIYALTGETTPCDVNGSQNRDYAGDIQETMALVDEISRAGYDVEIKIVVQKDNERNYFAAVSSGGSRVAIGTDRHTLARALCSLYMAYRGHGVSRAMSIANNP
jgi:ribosomal protein S9